MRDISYCSFRWFSRIDNWIQKHSVASKLALLLRFKFIYRSKIFFLILFDWLGVWKNISTDVFINHFGTCFCFGASGYICGHTSSYCWCDWWTTQYYCFSQSSNIQKQLLCILHDSNVGCQHRPVDVGLVFSHCDHRIQYRLDAAVTLLL